MDLNNSRIIQEWERRWLDPDNDRDFYHAYGATPIEDNEDDDIDWWSVLAEAAK